MNFRAHKQGLERKYPSPIVKVRSSFTSDRLVTFVCSDPKSLYTTRWNEINHFTNAGKGANINLWLQLGLLIFPDPQIGKGKLEGNEDKRGEGEPPFCIALSKHSLLHYLIHCTTHSRFSTILGALSLRRKGGVSVLTFNG